MAQLTEQQIEDQINKAIANQVKIDAVEPRANKVLFKDGRITIHFNNGAIFSFLVSSVEAIAQIENVKNINYEHYTYRVTWSDEDREFIGLCTEFPSLSYLDENRYAALEGITNLESIGENSDSLFVR